jgi:hypothetical protein
MGALPKYNSATVKVTNASVAIGGTATAIASKVTVDYPFDFIVLGPIAKLVVPKSTLGGSFTMEASAIMRNEAQ